MGWNHNIHYHDLVLRTVPQPCVRALDVGCGPGGLTQRLAVFCTEVVGIDVEQECVDRARVAAGGASHLAFVQGDILTHTFRPDSFDFIAVLATLHHLPLRAALLRFRHLLTPGGNLTIVGLYRTATPIDYLWAAVAFPLSRTMRLIRGERKVAAPLQEPRETLQDIRRMSAEVLPGAVIRRRLFFRYSLVWRRP